MKGIPEITFINFFTNSIRKSFLFEKKIRNEQPAKMFASLT